MFDLLQLLAMHNSRIVLIGVSLLGLTAGILGVYLLLRRHSLMADATSHATLPGIALAFLVQPAFGLSPRFLPGLLLGALLTGLLGMLCIQWIPRSGRIREDAAMGIVLSVFYGFGVALLGIILKMEQGAAGGLKGFIYGKTASMVTSDAWFIAVSAAVILLLTLLLYKEWKLLCFDEGFAGSQGWPVRLLDALLLGAVVSVSVIGLQAVGLILMIALLVIPAAAARFWTDKLSMLLVLAGAFGMLGAFTGAALSALWNDLPAGGILVLCQGVLFLISLLLGRKRGWVPRGLRHHRLTSSTRRQHALRAFYEKLEQAGIPSGALEGRVPLHEIASTRSWSPRALRGALRGLRRKGLIYRHPDGRWGLTRDGWPAAARLVRNHRLWELFLLHYADIAPAHVDRGADRIEHVLSPKILRHLEEQLENGSPAVPKSPHPLPWGDGI